MEHGDSVLVTDWERTGPHDFSLRIDWPAVQEDLAYDPRVLAQTIRQSGLIVAHAEYDVPRTHHTVLSALTITIDPDFRVPRGRPSSLEVRTTVREALKGRRTTGSLLMDFRILRDDVEVVRSKADFSCVSPAAYRRLRGPRHTVDWGGWPVPPPVAPELVGRHSSTDVALAHGDRPHRWILRNNTDNHLLFDHPVDHVPGLALLEAADQAVHAFLAPEGLTVTGIDAAYERYVEFARPCWIEAESLPSPGPGRKAVRIVGRQDGKPAVRIVFTGPGPRRDPGREGRRLTG
ncbi:A-factor biosynthesis protein [Streptomyces verrucosisporus]|nr:A-factor biosynthesis protein [Streptomyces verrucosisporus]